MDDEEPEPNTLHYGPAPTGRQVRRRKMKKIPLTKGNLVVDLDVPSRLVLPYQNMQEMKTMRYTAVTCDPDEFVQKKFSLRQVEYGRQTELFIVITMYNENEVMFCRTLHGVMKNIAHLTSRKSSKVWGPDSWQKVVVCIVADGRKKVHPRVLDCLTALGVYQGQLMKNMVNGKPVHAHMFEYTCGFGIDADLHFRYPDKGIVPTQIIFLMKEHNQKKINSHRWFFNAFGPILQPNICVLLDVGTRPGPNSLYHLWKAFDRNSNVGGACGEIAVYKGPWWSYLLNPLIAVQNYEYKMSNILDKPNESMFGYISVLPGAFSAYRYIALQNDKSTGMGPLASYFKGEVLQGREADIFTSNMYLAEDRILSFELVAKQNSDWFAIGNFCIFFVILTSSIENPVFKLPPKTIHFVNIAAHYLLATIIMACFLFSMGNRPKASPWKYTTATTGLALLTGYMVACAVMCAVHVIKQVHHTAVYRNMVFSLIITYGAWLASSILALDPWHLFTCLGQYTLLSPLYLVVLNIYAFANLDDITWGTKGSDIVQPSDLGNVVQDSHHLVEVEFGEASDEQYTEALENIKTRKPLPRRALLESEKHVIRRDYYANLRTNLLLAWALSNSLLVVFILNGVSPRDTFSNTAAGARSRAYMTFTLTDLNDFITPSQACIKPVETKNFPPVDPKADAATQIRIDSNGEYYEVEINSSSKNSTTQSKKLEKAEISLNDCLACSGCITSAESVLITMQSHIEVTTFLESNPPPSSSDHKVPVLSISPQALASLAASVAVASTSTTPNPIPLSIRDILDRVKAFATLELGIAHVFDTTFARHLALQEHILEFEERASAAKSGKEGSLPMLASACPGWVCYAEKTHAEMLPFISNTKSPQQVMGSLVKEWIGKKLGKSPEQMYHVSVMPCYDKKLEASRQDFYNEQYRTRDVDCVITTGELELLMKERGWDLAIPRQPPSADSFGIPDLLVHAGSSSGGWLQGVIEYVQERERKSGRNSSVRTKTIRTSDYEDVVVEALTEDGKSEIVFRGAKCYGFRNLQNVVRKIGKESGIKGTGPGRATRGRVSGAAAALRARRTKDGHEPERSLVPGEDRPYDYVEVMACPAGCVNGGGQIRRSASNTSGGVEETMNLVNGDTAGMGSRWGDREWELTSQIHALQIRVAQLEQERAQRVSFIAPFRRLPQEIIARIAEICIELGDSPTVLNRVCSSMRSAVNGMRELWGTIHIVPFIVDPSHRERVKEVENQGRMSRRGLTKNPRPLSSGGRSVRKEGNFCISAEHLRVLFERANSTLVDLSIVQPDAVDADLIEIAASYSDILHSLAIVLSQTRFYIPIMELPQLENLQIHSNNLNSSVKHILRIVDDKAPKLNNLCLELHSSHDFPLTEVARYQFYYRLRSLYLATGSKGPSDPSAPVVDLPELETLTLIGKPWILAYMTLPNLSFLAILGGTKKRNQKVVPHNFPGSITRLHLDHVRFTTYESDAVLLPRLTHLDLRYPSIEVLDPHFRMPALETMRMDSITYNGLFRSSPEQNALLALFSGEGVLRDLHSLHRLLLEEIHLETTSCAVFRGIPMLREWELRGCSLPHDLAETLAGHLAKNQLLEEERASKPLALLESLYVNKCWSMSDTAEHLEEKINSTIVQFRPTLKVLFTENQVE
ncbi:hypothetical protein FRC17_000832 [Serendipita sp. 399]|nr:hypothetical protein FRC17_000832 [Serendipita sp. 399]